MVKVSVPAQRESPPPPPESSPDDEAFALARVLELVRERTGLDFAGYRRPTLRRRLQNRMIVVGAQTMAEYLERLDREPEEAARLVERLTIKVSRFFRDEHTFTALREALVRRAVERSPAPLNVWSAGCGNGEEPYSLAVLLDDLGQRPVAPDVLGTDIDPSALAFAREATYPESALDGVTPDTRARTFEATSAGERHPWRVRAELRTRATFRLHDLAGGEGPPGRFDLVTCRNVLIYLQPPVQERAQMLLARGLLPGGLLCLGESEWLLPSVAGHFDVVDRKARLFWRRAEPSGVVA